MCSITCVTDQPTDPAAQGMSPVELVPDASLLDAVGRGHTLASALVHLIDNSVDAGPDRVSTQFVAKDAAVPSASEMTAAE